jgi:HK97 family phage major capsid protein/HK97 family phage prohead protease
MSDELKAPLLGRDGMGIAIEVRKDDDKTVRLSFPASSETPVERWFGEEVLSHDAKAIRMDRIKRGAMPLLFNHNWEDPIGVVDGARVEGNRLVVDAHLFATARAQEIASMVEGGLRNVSIGYRLHVVEEDKKAARFTATDWEPFEVSIVTVPADPTVGIGRQLGGDEIEVRMVRASQSPARPAAITGGTKVSDEINAAAGESAEIKATNPVEFEKNRKAAIRNLCVAYKLDERYERAWVEEGADLKKVSEDIMNIVKERNSRDETSRAFLDLDKADVRKYSLMRALRAAANNDWKDAGLELECNQEISKRLDRTPKSRASFFVPLDKMLQLAPRRDMTVAGASGSQYLVGTENQPGSFIDLLRNTSVALRMGVTKLSGLKGHVTIPKMTAGNTAYWLSDENTQITESQPTIGQLSLSPKNVAAITEVSHQLLSQSTPDAESLLLSSIARDIGLAVDVAVLRGSGASGQPTGIATTGSIGAFTGTSLAAAGLLDAQADVAAANALYPGCGYVTTPAVAALLMARPELPSTGTTRMWKGNMSQGSIFDFPAMSSAQMSSATMLFGWWPSVILAEWGVLELMVNPYSDFTRGLSAVRGWYTCDVGVRYAGAWSYSSSIT